MISKNMRLAAAAIVLITIAGCGSSTSGTPKPSEIDVRTLDVGKYPTEPLDTDGEFIHSLRRGTSLAVSRLANHVVTGIDIAPELRYGTGVQEITKPDDVSNVLAEQSVSIAAQNKLLFGFASGSSDFRPETAVPVPPESTLTTVTVMQFPDPQSAERAAAEFEAADFAVDPDQNERVRLAKYPLAHSHWRPGTPTIGSVVAHGNYVVNTFISTSQPDLTALTGLVEKVFTAQLPMLDALTPLSPEQVLRLDLDPEGVIRRVLNPSNLSVPAVGSLAAYELQGFLHWQTDRMAARILYARGERFVFSDAYSASTNSYTRGIAQSFGKGIGRLLEGAILIRSQDIDSAKALWSAILDAPDARQEPPNLPDGKCAELPTDRYVKDWVCAVRYRSYVGYVWSTQLQDAQQRAAAQYALLANSQ
ncbi:hypothetical protein F3087_23450 [Nocardia colli]|uniref:Uncharacterized protein n=1 Tax=Nocardia colli TaxID=2545717 RepID=A0A5N0EBY5_9NOCA|nr:hypothetical protein [Nocardia colli]KAA8886443.1 hypothetical protein F3087_23450 [Nocardia colli]